jgi:hypothetical protein
MEHFKAGETVVRRSTFPESRRGTVTRVTADGYFVTVQWANWLGLDGHESTHWSDDLVRVMAA